MPSQAWAKVCIGDMVAQAARMAEAGPAGDVDPFLFFYDMLCLYPHDDNQFEVMSVSQLCNLATKVRPSLVGTP